MLGSLSHPNIMRFMAISLDPPMIVMQYYSHGSLFALLQVNKQPDLPTPLETLLCYKCIYIPHFSTGS